MEFYKPEDIQYVKNVIRESNIIYTSMEIALHPEVHTYSGGLGVLAGDTLRSCADLRIPVTAITLAYRKGYFKQTLDNGWQREETQPWDVTKFTKAIPEARDSITLDGRKVIIEPRLGIIVGKDKHLVPVIFLDTDLEENDWQDKGLTAQLYGGDHKWRLKQEALLGIGGKRILRKLGCQKIHTFHMNEGHAAFAPMEDIRYFSKYYSFNQPEIRKLVKSAHVFTTHTPVPAGHDRFDYGLIHATIGQEDFPWESLDLGGHHELNMTKLALNLSRYRNGVAQKHGEISRQMFPGYAIDAITNGVHLPTWICPHIQTLLDKVMPTWRAEPIILQHCYQVIEPQELWSAHQESKQSLLAWIKKKTGRELSQEKMLVGFARRFATYKRADLILADMQRFIELCEGKVQFVFAGEAHPHDVEGKRIIQRIIQTSQQLQGRVDIVFIEDYDMSIAQRLVSGVDLWLNNPVPPMEASGTSGMKAAANGVPNLSTLDGWWIEGITKNPQSGWIIEHREDEKDHISLYDTFGHIIRVYYDHPDRWKEHMVHALSLAHYFNTHRMCHEYLEKAWTVELY